MQAGLLQPRGGEDASAALLQALEAEAVQARLLACHSAAAQSCCGAWLQRWLRLCRPCWQVVSFADWLRIDEAERENGAAQGKERLKFTSVQEMLELVRQS